MTQAESPKKQVVRPPAEFKPPKWEAKENLPASAALEPAGGSSSGGETLRIGGKGSYVIGRVDTADIVLIHSSISRHHCAVVHHTDGRVYVIDLKSACGTKIDGRRINGHSPTELRPNGTLSFGEDTQEYRLTGTSGKRGADPAAAASSGGSSAKRARPAHPEGQVQCSHLLIKHRDSRVRGGATHPTSSNPLKHKAVVTRSKEEALAILQGHLATLKERFAAAAAAAGGDPKPAIEAFAVLATTESDCSSAKRGGDLGPFEYHKMAPPFSAASFALKVGELCQDPVESDSGYHAIVRIA